MSTDFGKIYVNGCWVTPESTDTIALQNPATLQNFACVPDCSDSDVVSAIDAADAAFASWSQTPMTERIRLMQAMATHFESMADEIVELEAKELGSPVTFSRYSHCERQFLRVRHFIDAAKQVSLETKLDQCTVLREPWGVVACITPWNYPLGQIVQKVIPAVLMGNTVVLKPASNTPLTAYLLVEAFHRAGFPKGVVNLVTGRGSRLGNLLSTHPKIAMVSFTGSTDVGKTLEAAAAQTVKKTVLELGGKSAYIWLEADDYRPAMHKLVSSIFMNSGQTCTALSRLIVPAKDLKVIKELLLEAVSRLKVGDPTDPATDLGPVATKAQFETVKRYLQLGLEEGAELLCGRVPETMEAGYFIEPAVFVNVKNSMRIAQEEIFGPLVCVI
ncbi:MAG: aldehyde dehydrogenase family protein, partial [Sutterellaceae bacterium]|nr:aldehyde dehydrogenase family protein [Sutterellaceae bacterium]